MRLSLPLLALALLVGCNSPTLATRLATKTATLLALDATDADASDAQAIVALAVMTRAVVGEGDLDTDALRLSIIEALVSQFSGQQQLIYVAVVDELLTIIISEIANADPPLDLGEAGIYITAAALGVEQGATLYVTIVRAE